MKKYFLIIILITAWCQFCLAGGNQLIDSVTMRAKKLKQLYTLSMSASEINREIYRQQFFDEFPNNFKQLNELYGYDIHNHKAAPLYYETEKHIYGLFNNLDIDETSYYKKIILISIGGHWDADAINIFQNGLRQKTLKNPELVVKILEIFPNKDILSFWNFYFDGLVIDKQIAKPLQRIKLLDSRIYNLMIEAHNKLLKEPK